MRTVIIATTWLKLLLLVLLLATGAGCRSRAAAIPPPGLANTQVPEVLQPRYDQLVREGERNWVLHLNELAVAAMQLGERDLAERALSESMLNINNVFGSTPEAQRARQVFFSEDVKLFKGESHERAMAFLYRGILYMQVGDYENARACFRQGALQDAFAEESQFRDDWVIFDYLIAQCELELGRPGFAEASWTRAAETWSLFPFRYRELVRGSVRLMETLPPIDPEHNLLVICQQGTAPEKVRRGARGQYLDYRRGRNQPGPSRVTVENKTYDSWMIDSLFYQAKTRGGRPVDGVQRRKVIFRDTTDVVGTGGIYAGLIILSSANNEGQVVAGLIVLGAGLALKVASELTRTGADLRAWTSIPDSLSIHSGRYDAERVTLTVQAGTGRVTDTVPLAPPGRGLTVVLSFDGPNRTLLVPSQPTPRSQP